LPYDGEVKPTFIRVPSSEAGNSSPDSGYTENTWSPVGRNCALKGSGSL